MSFCVRHEARDAREGDVKEAHRQIPIAKEDWLLFGCRVRPGTYVFINTFGTFGTSSASYYWSRIGSGIGRLMQYVVGNSATTWIMLVADDFHLETSGAEYRSGIITLFVFCSLLGVPLSWGKTSGGDTLTWVEFELLHKSYRLGISQRRAEWFCRWCEEAANADTINTSSFEEGLGRITWELWNTRELFLSPLYKFLALHQRGSVRRIPSYVRFILKYLASEIARYRHFECAVELRDNMRAIRVDAQASVSRVWFPEVDASGVPNTMRSRWFALEITKGHTNVVILRLE